LGIPPELQPRIFERFFRADQARSRNAERNGSGAGLGLSIARWIAELHGGHLVLDASDQNGTTFVISLPLPQGAAAQAE
jgi:signal transduction histidine kinase